jgi:hypothetical protein
MAWCRFPIDPQIDLRWGNAFAPCRSFILSNEVEEHAGGIVTVDPVGVGGRLGADRDLTGFHQAD